MQGYLSSTGLGSTSLSIQSSHDQHWNNYANLMIVMGGMPGSVPWRNPAEKIQHERLIVLK